MANKRNLEGSRAKDAFLYWHKNKLPNKFYAGDIDLCLIRRAPFDIVAALDFKCKGNGDFLGFTHTVLYNKMLECGIPVYVLWAKWNGECKNDATFTNIDIYEYVWGNPKPNPSQSETHLIASNLDIDSFLEWQKEIRANYKRSITVFDLVRLQNDVFENFAKRTIDSFRKIYKELDEIKNMIQSQHQVEDATK